MPKKQSRQQCKKSKNMDLRSSKNPKKHKNSANQVDQDFLTPKNSKIQQPPAFHSFVLEIPINQNFSMKECENTTMIQLNSLSKRTQDEPRIHTLNMNAQQSVQYPQREIKMSSQLIEAEINNIDQNMEIYHQRNSGVFRGKYNQQQKVTIGSLSNIIPLWKQKAVFIRNLHDHSLNLVDMYFNQEGDYVTSRDRIHLLCFVIQDLMKNKKILSRIQYTLNEILENYMNKSYDASFQKLANTGIFRKTIGNRAIRFEAEYYSFKKMLKKRKMNVDNSFCIYCLVLSKVYYIQQQNYRNIQEWGKYVDILPQILRQWQIQKEKFYISTNQIRFKFDFMEIHYFSISIEKNIYSSRDSYQEKQNLGTNLFNTFKFRQNDALQYNQGGKNHQKIFEKNQLDSQQEIIEQIQLLMTERQKQENVLCKGKRFRPQHR